MILLIVLTRFMDRLGALKEHTKRTHGKARWRIPRLGETVVSRSRKMMLSLMADHTKRDQVIQCIVAQFASPRKIGCYPLHGDPFRLVVVHKN